MSEPIGIVEGQALAAFDGALDAIGCGPDAKVRLALLYVYDTIYREGYGIAKEVMIQRIAKIHGLLIERDKRAKEFEARQKELADKGFHGHPQKRDQKAAE